MRTYHLGTRSRSTTSLLRIRSRRQKLLTRLPIQTDQSLGRHHSRRLRRSWILSRRRRRRSTRLRIWPGSYNNTRSPRTHKQPPLPPTLRAPLILYQRERWIPLLLPHQHRAAHRQLRCYPYPLMRQAQPHQQQRYPTQWHRHRHFPVQVRAQ